MTDIPEDALVSAREVGRRFEVGGQILEVISGINVDVYPGEFVVLLGRSGSGKTTLLNLMGGLDAPSTGAVYIKGRDVTTLTAVESAKLRSSGLGFVFQSFGLLPLLSAQENVELPLRIVGVAREEREARALKVLDTVGLGHRLRHRPYELSGGEQQRVAIARALVHNPPLVLADEPTAELDSRTAHSIFELVAEVVNRDHVAVVVATHDRAALEFADRVLELEDGVLVSGSGDG